MVASTIQNQKLFQAFEDVMGLYEFDLLSEEDLGKLLNQVAQAVEVEPSVSASPTAQETIKSESVFSQMREVKDRSLQQFLTHRGSFF